jgi:hypothetical protein
MTLNAIATMPNNITIAIISATMRVTFSLFKLNSPHEIPIIFFISAPIAEESAAAFSLHCATAVI